MILNVIYWMIMGEGEGEGTELYIYIYSHVTRVGMPKNCFVYFTSSIHKYATTVTTRSL